MTTTLGPNQKNKEEHQKEFVQNFQVEIYLAELISKPFLVDQVIKNAQTWNPITSLL